MNYSDAVAYCRAHEIYKNKDTKEHFEVCVVVFLRPVS